MILTINAKTEVLEEKARIFRERLAAMILLSHAKLKIPDEVMHAIGVGIEGIDEPEQREPWFIAQKQPL